MIKQLSRLFLFLAAIIAMCGPLQAKSSGIATKLKLGVGLGGGGLASGLTARYYLGETSAVQASLGTNSWGFSFGGEYIQIMGNLAKHDAGELNWEVGGGASFYSYSVGLNSTTIIAINGLIGLVWHFAEFPLEVTAGWGPAFFIGDYIGGLNFGGGGGAIRWYF